MGIYFDYDKLLQQQVKQAGATWSQSNKTWYVELNRDNFEKIKLVLKGYAGIDYTGLKTYLEQKKNRALLKTPVQYPVHLNKAPFIIASKQTIRKTGNEKREIHPINAHVLPAMEQYLTLKAYSKSTHHTYLGEMRQLLLALKDIPADDLTPDHLKKYMVFCLDKLMLTENTLHSRINAMKLYYEQVLHREKFFWDIPRPKKTSELPKTFNQDEIAAIINSIKNIKHKTMLMLAYSAGLRVSEVVSIKTYDIDSKRMTVMIRQAKGKKDRMAPLSPVLLVMLREYALKYKPDKKGWLFEVLIKGTPYSSRSLQEVIQSAKQKVGIMKPGSIHSLRHSFATHLIDRGTDISMIQKLLGHNDIKTTLRYLHTSNKDLLRIVSPLDELKLI